MGAIDKEQRRVVLIGLDGASWPLLQRWIDDGAMPRLAGLARSGARGPLHTVVPPVTAAAWSSIVTGLNPGRHGIFEFLVKEGGWENEVPVSNDLRRGATLWDEVGAAGGRSIVLNMPVTYPPPEIEGELISGFLAPPGARGISSPPELRDELEALFGPYPLHITEVYARGRVGSILDQLFRELRHRRQVCRHLSESRSWNLFCVHIWGTDRLQHELWHLLDTTHPRHDPEEARRHLPRVREYFAELDGMLGELFEMLAPGDHGVIVSDHGFGPIEHYYGMNQILLELGFLVLRRDAPARIRGTVLWLGLSPLKVYRWAAALGLGRLRLSRGFGQRQALVGPLSRLFLSLRDVDWERTRAYSRGNYGQIFLNLKGREPRGCVEPGTPADDLLAALSDALRGVSAPDGRPLFDPIWRGSELYRGPFVPFAPDLIALPSDMRHKALGAFDFSTRRRFERATGNSGDHRLDGLLLMVGDRVAPGSVTGAHVTDIFPTVLRMLGIAPRPELDGASLIPETSAERRPASRPPGHPGQRSMRPAQRRRKSLLPDEAQAIRDTLRGVGYWA